MWTTSVEKATPSSPPGMGIRFQYSSDQERVDTEAVVEKLMTRELGELRPTYLVANRTNN